MFSPFFIFLFLLFFSLFFSSFFSFPFLPSFFFNLLLPYYNQWALSSRTNLCHTPEPVSPGEKLLHMSSALVFMSCDSVSAAATQGMPLNHPALEARGTFIPGAHGALTIRNSFPSRLPPSGHCTDGKLKHTSSLSEKETYLLSLALA